MTSILATLILGFQFITTENPSVPPIRMAKAHYVLTQNWNGLNSNHSDKVCEGDVEIPVFDRLNSDGVEELPKSSEIRCKVKTRPSHDANSSIEVEKIIYVMVDMHPVDCFGEKNPTKHFNAVMWTQGGKFSSESQGYAASQDLNLKTMDFGIHQRPNISFEGVEGSDSSTYFVSLRVTD